MPWLLLGLAGAARRRAELGPNRIERVRHASLIFHLVRRVTHFAAWVGSGGAAEVSLPIYPSLEVDSGLPCRFNQSSSARTLPVARAMQVSAPP